MSEGLKKSFSSSKIVCEIFNTKNKKNQKNLKGYKNLFNKLIKKAKIIIT